MKGTSAGRRYAKALFELASEQNVSTQVANDVEALRATWTESKELRSLMQNPAVGAEVHSKVIAAIAAKLNVHRTTANLLRLLAERGRMGVLGDICVAYQALAQDSDGKVLAEVTSAAPLTEDYTLRLRESLEKSLGRKVTLSTKVDASLLGGIVTRIGDKVFDGSVQTRLAQIAEALGA